MEAAGLRVEVEALRKAKDELQLRLGVAETHVCALTSTLNATFSGQQGVQSQGKIRSTSARQ